MNAKQVALHDVDGRRRYTDLDGLAEYVFALGAEFADMGRVGVPDDLRPPRSHRYRTAAALLSVYRSRIDFFRDRALDAGAESLWYRFTPLPALIRAELAVRR